MSTVGERKCALLLISLRQRDRRRLLARLPKKSASTIRSLVAELEAMPLPIADLGKALLADEVRGLTTQTSLDLDQLLQLAESLSAAWFARVLCVWTGVDREFCLAMLDSAAAAEVRRELHHLVPLPSKLADALRAETALLAPVKQAA